MNFVWDRGKNEANLKQHGISFGKANRHERKLYHDYYTQAQKGN